MSPKLPSLSAEQLKRSVEDGLLPGWLPAFTFSVDASVGALVFSDEPFVLDSFRVVGINDPLSVEPIEGVGVNEEPLSAPVPSPVPSPVPAMEGVGAGEYVGTELAPIIVGSFVSDKSGVSVGENSSSSLSLSLWLPFVEIVVVKSVGEMVG